MQAQSMKDRQKAIKLLSSTQIGCGLVRIGRIWGTKEMVIPTEEEVVNFLNSAYKMGVRVFDTAPAYGSSEERLGTFLWGLGKANKECFVATKCGEEFDAKKNRTNVNHSPDALKISIEQSLNRLPHITLLQLHKANKNLLQNDGILELLAEYKKSRIPLIGACVTDIETAEYALELDVFDSIQFPYNMNYPAMEPMFKCANDNGKLVLVSRPFASGEHADETRRALEFVIKKMKYGGAILVGTNNSLHLKEDIDFFKEIYGG